MVMPSPPSDDLTHLASRYLMSYWQHREHFARTLAPILKTEHDLELRDYAIMRYLESDSVTPSLLAEILQMPGYATSRLIDPLIKKGLITRSVDTGDARKYRLQLTDQGKMVTRAIEARFSAELARMFERLGKERTLVLLEIMEALSEQNE